MSKDAQAGARRVLLTGATGFIGRNCIAPLVGRGFEVVAAYNTRAPAPMPGVRWVQADLLEVGAPVRLIAQTGPTHLLHLAWYVEPGKMITSPDNLAWVRASLELLQAFHEAGGQRCVFGGSCYEYDWRHGYCVEGLTPLTPDTLYGSAKAGLAQTLLGYCASTGLSGAWSRLFFLYGPHENPRRLMPSVLLSLLDGKEALSSHGNQIRDYMHVRDAAEGLVALLDTDARGAYNVASGAALTIRSIIETLGELTGRTDLLRLGALPARANDAPLVLADVQAARRDFGWAASIGLREGLQDTLAWWRAQRGDQGNR